MFHTPEGEGQPDGQTMPRDSLDFDGTRDLDCVAPGGGWVPIARSTFAIYCAREMRCTVFGLTPCLAAITRTPGRCFLRRSARIARSMSASI
jgi:hypothetical protein